MRKGIYIGYILKCVWYGRRCFLISISMII
nr:MAG TPA: hypothetical protein [Caudoviricetes sp.]